MKPAIKSKPAPTPADLVTEAEQLATQIDAIVDARAEALKQRYENLPVAIIRNLITKSEKCHCKALKNLMDYPDE
jgi:hypothetical protein